MTTSANHFYVVSAHQASGVSIAVRGNFTGPNDLNLILAKGSHFEINLIAEDGLRKLLNVSLYGRIAVMELYRPSGRKTDLLFVITERYKFCVLSWDADSSEIITEAMGDLIDRTGRQAENGCIASIDPKARLILVHAYQGVLRVIPMLHPGNTRAWSSASRINDTSGQSAKGKAAVREKKMGELGDAFNLRLDELQVHALTFLDTDDRDRPLIVVLCQDTKEQRHVKTYEVSMPQKELVEGPWMQARVDEGAQILIPVPAVAGGGVLVIGEHSVTYLNGKTPPVDIQMKLTMIKCYAQIDADGSRYLLGDYLGNLFVLVAYKTNACISELKIERLGETSMASALTYLDNGYVHIGSHYGDSQLIRLTVNKEDSGNFFQIIDTYSNLAPVVDFTVVDLERQGQGQIVACCGVGKDGSLRIVRNGIGINEIAELEMTGLRSVWALRPHFESIYDDTIILSFTNETRLLYADMDGEIKEVEDAGAIRMNESTLFAINMSGDNFIQITLSAVYLLSTANKLLKHAWEPPAGFRIVQASANFKQVILALSGGRLIYLELSENKELIQISDMMVEHEISCVDISPLEGHQMIENICVVGLWGDGGVQVLRIPDWTVIATESLGEEVIPRSVNLAMLDGIPYLLAALGDGTLYNFMMDSGTGTLRDRRKISLGTQPVSLRPFRGSDGRHHVFAASDRPTVIYSSNQKLLYSNVNLKEVIHMTPFNLAAAPNALALATPDRLRIGTVDEVQKLHIRTVPLGEFARRIAHDDVNRVFGLLTTRVEVNDGGEVERSFFKIIDDQTFDVIDAFELQKFEMPEAITVMTFFNDPQTTFAIGTAFAISGEDEPTRGRILLFRLTKTRRLSTLAITEVPGSAYSIISLQERLVASVNSRVVLFNFEPNKESLHSRLTPKSSHHGHIIALYLASHGHILLVGDMMRSVSVLQLGAGDSLEEVAKDYATHWMTAIQMLDDETYIGGDSTYNLLAWRKRSEGVTDEERQKLELIGEWHLADQVNRIRPGSLVIQLPDSQPPAIPRFLFCTLTGTLGVICTMNDDMFALMSQVEVNLSNVIKGVGGLDHAEYRSFIDERRIGRAGGKNFIDGDFVERILELDEARLCRVIEGNDETSKLNVTPEELVRLIEDLSRLH